MKPLRSPIVLAILTNVMAAYLAFAYRTLRWTREGQDIAEDVWSECVLSGSGAILALWHSRVPVGPTTWPQGPVSSKWSSRSLTAMSIRFMGGVPMKPAT